MARQAVRGRSHAMAAVVQVAMEGRQWSKCNTHQIKCTTILMETSLCSAGRSFTSQYCVSLFCSSPAATMAGVAYATPRVDFCSLSLKCLSSGGDDRGGWVAGSAVVKTMACHHCRDRPLGSDLLVGHSLYVTPGRWFSFSRVRLLLS